MPSKIKQYLEKLKADLRTYCLTGLPEAPLYKRMLLAMIAFVRILWSEIRINRTFMRASSVTYTTTLALIPFLAVGGSFILMFNRTVKSEDIVAHLIDFITEFIGPLTDDQFSTLITDTLTRALNIGLGPIGIIALLVTTVMLFITIQDSVNDIWHVRKGQKLYLRILIFYALVTLGPVVISISIYQATQIISALNADMSIWKYVQTSAVSLVASFLLFKFLPNTRVKVKHAFIPAILFAVIFEITKYAFSYYMSIAFNRSYDPLYGAISFVPITLFWIYISWTLMFLGVQTCYCTQNFRKLIMASVYDADQSDEQDDVWFHIGPYAPLEVTAALVRALEMGQTPVSAEALSIECQYPQQAVEAVLSRLVTAQFVNTVNSDSETKYVIAKPLDALSLNEIMDLFDESTPRATRFEHLNAIVSHQTEQRHTWLEEKTANDLRESHVE